jgi:methionyl-tRNA formyltransferase
MAARRLRTVFFGASAFSVASLERMLVEHDVVAVCSQPDRPAGRGLKLAPTPVTVVARRAHVQVLTPNKLDAAFIAQVASLRPQLLACASYGKILPAALLELPGASALNVHPSLLPLYRGATPIQSALRDGCTQTGLTIFWMTPRMDAGDIALSRIVAIEESDDYGTLHDRLAHVGGELLGEAAMLLSEERLGRTPQREEDATYCKPLVKDDLRLALDKPARAVVDQIRSLSPKPGAWMPFAGKRLKVLEAAVAELPPDANAAPGELVAAGTQGALIATSGGAIRLIRVIPQGRSAMSGTEFAQLAAARS